MLSKILKTLSASMRLFLRPRQLSLSNFFFLYLEELLDLPNILLRSTRKSRRNHNTQKMKTSSQRRSACQLSILIDLQLSLMLTSLLLNRPKIHPSLHKSCSQSQHVYHIYFQKLQRLCFLYNFASTCNRR